MLNTPTQEELEKLPKLYETENISIGEKIVQMHFSIARSDWYMTEYCPNDRLFFGYVILNDDFTNSEWGYTSFDELNNIKIKNLFEIEREQFWIPSKVKDVERIVKAHKHKGLEDMLKSK